MPYRRKGSRRFWWPILLLIAAVALRAATTRPSPPRDPQQLVSVERVVDGDTLIVAGGMRVRLIGINTPELARDGRPDEPGAIEARDFLQNAVTGRAISLGFDREPFDKYGRRLAYVYDHGKLINEEIIRAGLSRAQTQYHYNSAMKTRFLRAEHEAQGRGAGQWSEAAGPASTGAADFQNE